MGAKKPHGITLPRLYKASAEVLKKVKKGDGLRDSIANSSYRNSKAISALVYNTMKNDALLDFILENTDSLNGIRNRDVAKVLVTELLWGKKHLIGDSKPVRDALACCEELKKAAEKSGISVVRDTVRKPCYARINTLLTTVEGTIQRFVDDGWKLVDTPDSYEVFLELINDLSENHFIQDFHFNDVLVFPSRAELHEHKLVENGFLVLQNKPSCLATYLLNPKPGSKVLDMCAAPGLITAHLASLMRNKGTLYAVDKNPKRFGKLENEIQRYCGKHSCVTTILGDATGVTDKECSGVQYIMVNPSCSGTGRIKQIEDCSSEIGNTSHRIQKLSNFQERLLIQALTAFPDVERVVYYTNSTLLEENEKVLERVLGRVPCFQVASPDLKKPWEHRGDPQYPYGSHCLVANKDKDYAEGFFVAVLERIEKMAPTKGKSLKRKSAVAASDEWEFSKKKNRVKGKKSKMDTNEDADLKVLLKNGKCDFEMSAVAIPLPSSSNLII